MRALGYVAAGYVYSVQTARCDALWECRQAAGALAGVPVFLLGRADRPPMPLPPDTTAPKVLCFLPRHYGTLRIRLPPPAPELPPRWLWSREALQSGWAPRHPMDQVLLCRANPMHPNGRRGLLETRVARTVNGADWVLECPVRVHNSLPCPIYVAVTRSADLPPGSNCVALEAGQEVGICTFPDHGGLLDDEVMGRTDPVPAAYHLWASLCATTHTCLLQGVARVGALRTPATPAGQEPLAVAPIKVVHVETAAGEPLEALLGRPGVAVHVQPHLWTGKEAFTINVVPSGSTLVIQVRRDDKNAGWDGDLSVSWEIRELHSADGEPQVSLEHWSAPVRVPTSAAAQESLLIKMTDEARAVSLELGVSTTLLYGDSGPPVIDLFCPYCIENQSDMRIWLDGAGDETMWRSGGGTLLYAPPTSLSATEGNIVSLRAGPPHLAATHCSEPLDLDALVPFRRVLLSIPDDARQRRSSSKSAAVPAEGAPPDPFLGVQFDWGSESMLWRRLTLLPAVRVQNDTAEAVCLCWFPVGGEAPDQGPDDRLGLSGNMMTVARGGAAALNVGVAGLLWSVRVGDAPWVCEFPIDDPELSAVVGKYEREDGTLALIEVAIAVVNGTYRLRVAADATPPIAVENLSATATLRLYQAISSIDPECIPRHTEYVLRPCTAMGYTLDSFVDRKGFFLGIEGAVLKPEEGSAPVALEVRWVAFRPAGPVEVTYVCDADAIERTLCVAVFEEWGRLIVVAADAAGDIRQSRGLPADREPERLEVELTLELPSVSVSIVDSKALTHASTAQQPEELLLCTLDRLRINYSRTSTYVRRHVSLDSMQVDHQLGSAGFQAVLLPKRAGGGGQREEEAGTPFAQAAWVTRRGNLALDCAFDVHEHITLALQPTSVRLDAALFLTYQRLCAIWEALPAFKPGRLDEAAATVDRDSAGRLAVLFERVDLNPFEVLLSTAFEDSHELQQYLQNRSRALRSVVVTVGSFSELPLRFAGLHTADAHTTLPALCVRSGCASCAALALTPPPRAAAGWILCTGTRGGRRCSTFRIEESSVGSTWRRR